MQISYVRLPYIYVYIYIFERAKKLAIHSAPSAFLPEETSDKLPPYADAIERATRGIVSPPPLSFHSLIFLEEGGGGDRASRGKSRRRKLERSRRDLLGKRGIGRISKEEDGPRDP